jgi:hypothetical protein
MKKLAIITGTALILAAAVSVYYYSAWSTARMAALAKASGAAPVLVADPAQSLSVAVSDDQLRVRTGSGWFQPSDNLAFPFVVTDSSTHRSVYLAVDVRLTTRGWQVVRVGKLDG